MRERTKQVKKFLKTIIVLLCIVIVAIWGAVWYVKPTQEMDLKYAEISIAAKVADMIKQFKPEVLLTELDVNNLIKKHLAQHQELPHNLVVKGADFRLQGDLLEADVNVLWDYKVHIGAKLFFQLNWNQPSIEVMHTGTQIKDIQIPLELFEIPPITIPVEDNLPAMIGIKDVVFDPQSIRLGLKLK
jgi:hypothetical protein